jgi:hypothetical protein
MNLQCVGFWDGLGDKHRQERKVQKKKRQPRTSKLTPQPAYLSRAVNRKAVAKARLPNSAAPAACPASTCTGP